MATGGLATLGSIAFIWNSTNEENGQQKIDKQVTSVKDLPLQHRVILFGSAISVFIGFNIAIAPFFVAYFKRFGRIPFVSTSTHQVNTLFELLPKDLQTSNKVPVLVDLGSGDGRIVIEAAKKGFDATGYEINPWLVWYARRKARAAGVENNAKFVLQNFWDQNLSKVDVVTIFGVNNVMERLAQKLESELSQGSVLVSNSFRIPKWKPLDMKDDLWLYEVRSKIPNEKS